MSGAFKVIISSDYLYMVLKFFAMIPMLHLETHICAPRWITSLPSGPFPQVLSLPGPDPRETTRLAMRNEELGLVCHLSAMTVGHGPAPDLYNEKAAKLGPDPLREDANQVCRRK